MIRQTVKFNSKHYQDETFLINSQNNSINNTTKFLGLELDKHIKCKNHIKKNVPKLSHACFVGISVYSDSNMSTLKMNILACYSGIWHILGELNRWQRVLLKQKGIIRIMTGSSSRTS